MGSITTPPPGTTPKAATAPTFSIRKATLQDAEQIAALGAAVFTHTFKESGCTAQQLRSYLDEAYTVAAIRATLTSPAQDTLVATSIKLLGFAVLNHTTSPSEPAIAGFPHPVEVQRLYVDLGAHGRGIGTALMAAVEELAKAQGGYETAWLGVWERNFRAQKVYGRLGYRRVGEHVFDVGGDEQTDWIMVKAL
ncbi:hypothetical protein M406DRAFT_44705 [Cryphonectria parasitica EP155]|uniref:N-acetyltransferase domain-containing protein n=1 Tax=Cryphonectria parasitica (strain ATCC 38755 / EP155) TaxID=660469 RepID=A0A9P4Y8N2_CRYP1|nr:uncharacterized protein M406DRAFT_44705 [Cryphonectria parasitica EP155]KAF3768823.1 hypothetical protein M406DRAFT_44705 [Cryphonectria parasitica EP155]